MNYTYSHIYSTFVIFTETRAQMCASGIVRKIYYKYWKRIYDIYKYWWISAQSTAKQLSYALTPWYQLWRSDNSKQIIPVHMSLLIIDWWPPDFYTRNMLSRICWQALQNTVQQNHQTQKQFLPPRRLTNEQLTHCAITLAHYNIHCTITPTILFIYFILKYKMCNTFHTV